MSDHMARESKFPEFTKVMDELQRIIKTSPHLEHLMARIENARLEIDEAAIPAEIPQDQQGASPRVIMRRTAQKKSPGCADSTDQELDDAILASEEQKINARFADILTWLAAILAPLRDWDAEWDEDNETLERGQERVEDRVYDAVLDPQHGSLEVISEVYEYAAADYTTHRGDVIVNLVNVRCVDDASARKKWAHILTRARYSQRAHEKIMAIVDDMQGVYA